MIKLDMANKKGRVLADIGAFEKEENAVTLQVKILSGLEDYPLDEKTITAAFNPSGKETGTLLVLDGLIQIPITSEYVRAGYNEIQLNFRYGNVREQSPIIVCKLEKSIAVSGIGQGTIDMATYLINELTTSNGLLIRIRDALNKNGILPVGEVNSDNDVNLDISSPGTYTLKYENADGVISDYASICTMEVG